jgi:hypothetical protein
MAKRGQAGDLFGAINALFSGLAFAGIITAIFLQQRELEYQWRELSRTAAAQEASQRALRETIYANSLKAAIDILQARETRDARGFVRGTLRVKPFADWTTEDKETARIVCHTYNTVGIMTLYDALPVEWVARNWTASLIDTWDILEPLVMEDRARAPAHWDNFQRLAIAAKKFRDGNG